MNTAIVELDTLTNSIRTATKDDHFGAVRDIGFAFLHTAAIAFIGAIHIRCQRRELSGAGIYTLEGGDDIQFEPIGRNCILLLSSQFGQARV